MFNNSEKIQGLLKPFIVVLMCFIYNSAYLLLANADMKIGAGYLALFGQVGLDMIIFGFVAKNAII